MGREESNTQEKKETLESDGYGHYFDGDKGFVSTQRDVF